MAKGPVTALLTDPNGHESTYTFNPVDQNYKAIFTPTVGGTWNLTWVAQPYIAGADFAYVEGAQLDTSFFVYDPDASEDTVDVEDNVTEPLIELNTSSTDSVKPPTTQQTQEDTEDNKSIPGNPITALALGVAAFYLIKRSENYQIL